MVEKMWKNIKRHGKKLNNSEIFLKNIKKMLNNIEELCKMFSILERNGKDFVSIKVEKNANCVLIMLSNQDIISSTNLNDNLVDFTCMKTQESERIVKMVKVESAAKFLASLYFKTGRRYTCTKTKIEKMLTIAWFIKLRNGEQLFINSVLVNNCGTGVSGLEEFEATVNMGTEVEDGKRITDCICLEETNVPEIYKEKSIGEIDNKIKKLLVDVFREFGNCKASDIGTTLDVFKDDISIFSELYDRYILDFQKARNLFLDSNDKYEENKIMNFVIGYEDI